ncbi:MAG: VOC family protein [Ruminiclostridium sp.]|nr:VOC family protein [Ruminiclostridium sp.]
MKFVWTTIQVRDLDRSLAFYHDLLGMPVCERFQGNGNEITMLGDPEGTKLELLCKPGGEPDAPGQGLSLGLAPQDLPALLENLRAAGLDVTPPISPNPHLVFYFVKDPDGYSVQLVQQSE